MYIEFEPGQKHSSKLADVSDSHEAFKDAGWILDESDYVIDIDDLPRELIEKLIVAFDIRTQTVWTSRGVHLYYKRPTGFRRGANRVSPLGFKYEIKHKGNTKAVTIKTDGKLRKIDNFGIREEAPFIFTSRKKHDVLYGMDEGEGRNQALFRLRSSVGTRENWRKILTFVNDHIFATPLPEDEFATLTREMVIEAEKDNEYEIATYLMRELDFIQYGQRYYFRHEGQYTHEEAILRKEVYSFVGPQKTRYVDEVIKQMQYRCKKIPQNTIFQIRFLNGYLENGEFIELVTDDFSPYNIEIEYDPEAEPDPLVDQYIDHLTKSDPDYRALLLEILGHTLIVDPELKRMLAKFFIFVGDGGNGKGTLLEIIRKILGQKNVTGMSISELADERYLPSFKGMLANLGDDIQDQAINDKDMKTLKNISTCDFISTRELYKGAENLYFTGSLIFTSNHILKSWEKGESYKRRVMWLPMYTRVTKKDPKFITNLTSERALKYWIRLIVEGYKRLYEQEQFTESKIVDRFNEQYHRENNPALEYVEEAEEADFDTLPVKEVYEEYEKWCNDNAVKFSEKMIRDVLLSRFTLEVRARRVNGKPTKCFMKVKDEDE